MMKKKAMEMSLNTIIVAIIVIIVAIVIIAIFSGTISNIAAKFNANANDAGNKSKGAIDNLDFFSCKESQLKCQGSDVYICKNSKWEMKENCPKGCKDGSCT